MKYIQLAGMIVPLTGVMDTVVEVDLIKTDLTEGMEDVEVIADQL